jgi:hypothetical protein
MTDNQTSKKRYAEQTSRLDENFAGDSVLWDKMRTVDRLLSNEPMIEAPVDFAAKVMASIAAGKQPEPVHSRNDLRVAIGLTLTVVILLPLVLTSLLVVQRWLSDPAALSVLLRQIMVLVNTIAQAFASIIEVGAQALSGNMIMVMLATAFLSIFSGAIFVRWFGSLRREVVVYRIPVIAA